MLHKVLSGVLIAATAMVMTTSTFAGPVEFLPGRWTGWGQMTMDGGQTERVKCIATYFSEEGGTELRHNLRCASSNYQIDAVALLTVSSGRVSGKWEERKYETGGDVTGQVVDDGFDVSIVGHAFEASLKVETTKCKQTMNIAPKGMGVALIAVDLVKC